MSALNLFAFKPKSLTLKGNGNTVHIRAMTGAERAQWLVAAHTVMKEDRPAPDHQEVLCQLLLLTIADENGKQLFDSIDQVKQIPGVIQDEIVTESRKLNGLTSEESK